MHRYAVINCAPSVADIRDKRRIRVRPQLAKTKSLTRAPLLISYSHTHTHAIYGMQRQAWAGPTIPAG